MKLFNKIKRKLDNVNKHGREGLIELTMDLSNKNNKFHCQKCKSRLSFFKMIVKAKGVNVGEYYKVKCIRCKHINKIKKGEN